MRNLVSLILGLGIAGYFIYVVYQVLTIALGLNEQSFRDIKTHLIVAVTIVILVFFGALSSKKNANQERIATSKDNSSLKANKHKETASKPKETNTLIITANEAVCEKLEKLIQDNPLVLNTFQDTGNWYTNGETGPEWFTLHIETASKNCNKIDALVDEQLNLLNKSAINRFWQ